MAEAIELLETRNLLAAVDLAGFSDPRLSENSWGDTSLTGYLSCLGQDVATVDKSAASGQVFHLDFDGATDVTYRGPVEVAGMDVPALSLDLWGQAGREADFVSGVIASLNTRFASLEVTFTATAPASVEHSTIFVGGSDEPFGALGTFVGLVEDLDHGNQNRTDRAFVFADILAEHSASLETFTVSLVDVIAHEVTHLIGGEHQHSETHSDNPLAALAFSSHAFFGTVGDPIHEDLTASALRSLKPSVLELFDEAHAHQDDVFTPDQYNQGAHFDGSHFIEGVDEINAAYQAAIDAANPNAFDAELVAAEWGKVLHASQDFYAHSNWAELQDAGLLAAGTLLDSGLGTVTGSTVQAWTPIVPYQLRDGIMFVEGDPSAGITLTRNERVVLINGTIGGVISGTVDTPGPGNFYGSDATPDNVALSHGGIAGNADLEGPGNPTLAKDSNTAPLFQEAKTLAFRQTQHEYNRLLSLIERRWGAAAKEKLANAWTGGKSFEQVAQTLNGKTFSSVTIITHGFQPSPTTGIR